MRPAQPLTFPAGFQNVTGAPDSGVYGTLAKVTELALTKRDFDKVLGELSTPNQERARQFKGADQGKLVVQIDRIRQAWKTKYGKDFSVDEKVAFGSPLLIFPRRGHRFCRRLDDLARAGHADRGCRCFEQEPSCSRPGSEEGREGRRAGKRTSCDHCPFRVNGWDA